MRASLFEMLLFLWTVQVLYSSETGLGLKLSSHSHMPFVPPRRAVNLRPPSELVTQDRVDFEASAPVSMQTSTNWIPAVEKDKQTPVLTKGEWCGGDEAVETKMAEIQEKLQTVFGFKNLRGQQANVIRSLLCGKDTFAIMPTGAGKSLCYQLPALLSVDKVTLVVTPLLALMLGQVNYLKKHSVAVGALYSSQRKTERDRVMSDLFGGSTPEQEPNAPKLRLLYVTPELLCTSGFQSELMKLQRHGYINFFAIDEAHCVSEWGHEFRPSFRKLGTIHSRLRTVPWLALTATATHKVKEDVISILQLDIDQVFMQSFDRPNIRYHVRHKELLGDSDDIIIEDMCSFIAEREVGSTGIIYCHTRKSCEELAQKLCETGINTKAYHAGLSYKDRSAVQQEWMAGTTKIVCATVAFGMGIDKSDVRFVIHYSMPKSLESYYQETGRAGRDGKDSEALLYYSKLDLDLHRFLIERTNADMLLSRLKAVKSNLGRITKFCTSYSPWAFEKDVTEEELQKWRLGGAFECRRVQLLRYFGEESRPGGGRRDPSRCCDACCNRNFARRAELRSRKCREHESPLHPLRGRNYYSHAPGGGGELTAMKHKLLLDGYCNITVNATEAEEVRKEAALLHELQYLPDSPGSQQIERKREFQLASSLPVPASTECCETDATGSTSLDPVAEDGPDNDDSMKKKAKCQSPAQRDLTSFFSLAK